MKNWLSIGEFGKSTGLSTKALRIYEEKELLVPHARSESQYRVYTAEQISTAQRIVQFKNLGFSLEQIKILLRETNETSLQILLEKRLQESRVAFQVITTQIESLENILASLKLGQELTEIERGQVMENLLDVSVDKLKRKGIVDSNSVEQVRQEIALYTPEKKQFVQRMRKILEYAKSEDILVGPGRGSMGSSLVMFAEGYLTENPLQHGLLPELFGETKYVWIDVEYSRHQQVGDMCNDLANETETEVVAFRCPLLDIFKTMEKKVGKVEFDSFSDTDPLILNAAKNGNRGLYWLEWNPNFHAFQNMPKESQAKYFWDNQVLEKFYSGLELNRTDYQNMDALMSLGQREHLFSYPSRTAADCPSYLPELKYTKGLLLFREDWIKLAVKHAGISVVEASNLIRTLNKTPDAPQAKVLDRIVNSDIRDLLIARVPKVYSKAHGISGWWSYKRTAILKSLWPKEYLATLDEWEQKHGMAWFEFGYKTNAGKFFLTAGS